MKEENQKSQLNIKDNLDSTLTPLRVLLCGVIIQKSKENPGKYLTHNDPAYREAAKLILEEGK